MACLQEAADEELTRVRDADAAVLYALADGLGTLVRVPDPDEQSAA